MIKFFDDDSKYSKSLYIEVVYSQSTFSERELDDLCIEVASMLKRKICIVHSVEIKLKGD